MRSPDSLTNQGWGWFGEEGGGHLKKGRLPFKARYEWREKNHFPSSSVLCPTLVDATLRVAGQCVLKVGACLQLFDSPLLILPFEGPHWGRKQDSHWAEQWNGAASLPVCRRPRPGYFKSVPRSSDGFVRILCVGFLCQISANDNELFTSILYNSLWVCLPQKPMRKEGCDPVTRQVYSNLRSLQHSAILKNPFVFFLMPERPRFQS